MPQLGFIFDLEGVLIDHTPRQCQVASGAFTSVGVSIQVTPEMYQLRSEPQFHVSRDFLSGLYTMQTAGLTPQQAKDDPKMVDERRKALTPEDWLKLDQARKNYERLRTDGVLQTDHGMITVTSREPRLPKVKRMLYLANLKGDTISLVSAARKRDAEAFMQAEDILKYFNPELLFYGEDKSRKEEMFRTVCQIMLEKYGIPKNRQFVVEDSLSGIRDAHTVGIESALLLTGNTSLARVRRGLEPEERPSLLLANAEYLTNALIAARRKPIERVVAQRTKA